MDLAICDIQDIKDSKRGRTWASNFQEVFNNFLYMEKFDLFKDFHAFQVNLFEFIICSFWVF